MGDNTSPGHPYPPAAGASQHSAGPAVQGVNVLRWRQVLRGEDRQLGVLRRWLSSMLPECPARDDVASVAVELASNALRHTASGRGGWFAVELTRYPSIVRVAVADQGGPAEPHVIDDPDAEHGRGLLLVRGLSVRTGVTGDQRGRLVWADVAFGDLDDAGASQDPYEVAIREGQAALARRFGDVTAWFGRATLAWWALAGPGGLVTAPSAPELAGLLYRLLEDSSPRTSGAADNARRDAVAGWDQAAGPGRARSAWSWGTGTSSTAKRARGVVPTAPILCSVPAPLRVVRPATA